MKKKTPAKEKQICSRTGDIVPLISVPFCDILRKKLSQCVSIASSLFLVCYQKYIASKCKQFCFAKPALCHLSVSRTSSRDPVSRLRTTTWFIAVTRYSAHTPTNSLSLKQMSDSAACFASRPLVTSVGLSRCASAWGGLPFWVGLWELFDFRAALPTTDNRKGCPYAENRSTAKIATTRRDKACPCPLLLIANKYEAKTWLSLWENCHRR